MKLTEEQERMVKRIAEIVHYGVEWVRDSEESYSHFGMAIETLGHQAACCICQWFVPNDGVPTAETIDALNLRELPSRLDLEAHVRLYVLAYLQPVADAQPPIKAVYRSRSDGDYDFVAAFTTDTDTMPMLSQADANQTDSAITMLSEAIKGEGDEALILEFGNFSEMPDVWEGPDSQTKGI